MEGQTTDFYAKANSGGTGKIEQYGSNIDVYIIPDMKNRKAAGKYGHREGRRKAKNAGMQALWELD